MTPKNAIRILFALLFPMFASHALAADEWITDKNGCKVWATPLKPKASVTWSGACKDGYVDGPGTLQWTTDGALTRTFEGSLSGGKFNGQGKETDGKGGSFEGDYVDGLRQGKGVAIFSDGTRYEGDYAAGKRTGKGTFSWPDGMHYKGDVIDGKLSGKGVLTFASGEKYEGDFVDDKRTGKGEYTWVSGNRYEGEVVDGRLEGKGVMTKINGDIYEGYWKDGKFDGLGRMSHLGTFIREGEFKDGQFITSRDIADTRAMFNIKGCAPHYSKEALDAREGGVARVKFEIGTDNKLISAKLIDSTGFPDLDDATIAALSRCTFKAEIKNGKAYASTILAEYGWKPIPPKVPLILTKLKGDEGVVVLDVLIVDVPTLYHPSEIPKQNAQEATDVQIRNLATERKYSAKFDHGVGIFVVPEGNYCVASFDGLYNTGRKTVDSYFHICKGESIVVKKGIINNAGEWWIAQARSNEDDPYHAPMLPIGEFENSARAFQRAVNAHPELFEN